MFGYQSFLEVFAGLKVHKMRAIFTGFGVMWAMLILVLLQGAGAGLYNGMVRKLHSYGDRMVSICAGYRCGDPIHLTEVLADGLASNLNLCDQMMPLFHTQHSIAYGQNVHRSGILGVRVGYEKIKHLEPAEGRFFTERDLAQRLPVCILGLRIKKVLFGTQAAVGQFIIIHNTVVHVIGVLEATDGMDDDQVILPGNVFKALFPQDAEYITAIIATLSPAQSPIQLANKVRTYLGRQLHFEPQDKHALHIDGASKRANAFQLLFRVMQLFIWFVGFCFLLSGIVGVGNMMLVVVKDRTQELAIRKVIGAKSSDIIGLILLESIVINLISGILGIGGGITILQWMNRYLVPMIQSYGIARFDFEGSMVLSALAILMLSGCLAGLIPAKRAWYIKPVNALNKE